MLYTGYEGSDAGGKKDYPLTRLKWWCSKYANLFLCWSAMLFNVPLTTCIYSRPQKSCVFMNQSCLLSLINNNNNNNKGGGGIVCLEQKNFPPQTANNNEWDRWKLYLFICFRRLWPNTMTDTHGKVVPALPKIKKQSNKGTYFICQLLTKSGETKVLVQVDINIM